MGHCFWSNSEHFSVYNRPWFSLICGVKWICVSFAGRWLLQHSLQEACPLSQQKSRSNHLSGEEQTKRTQLFRAYILYSNWIFTGALWNWLLIFHRFKLKCWASRLNNVNRAIEIKNDRILLNSECQVSLTLLCNFMKTCYRNGFPRAPTSLFSLSPGTPMHILNLYSFRV